MRLSTKIALGRVLGKPWTKTDTSGSCALQMAGLASSGENSATKGGEGLFGFKVDAPCNCENFALVTGPGLCKDWPFNKESTLPSMVIHLHNHHVIMKEDWTLEQLIDWVRSVEPPEPEPAAQEQSLEEELVEICT